jgi:hypothetical protein
MNFNGKSRRSLITLICVLILCTLFVTPVYAVDTVSFTITGGTLTASVADATITGINYSHIADDSSGTLNLSIDDSTGTGLGWNVQVSSSDFVYGGTSPSGIDIPNTGFAIGTPGAPGYVTGQTIDGTGGPLDDVGGSLDTPRRTIYANEGFGSGQYTQALPVTLQVPAFSQAGTYVADLTVDIIAGP